MKRVLKGLLFAFVGMFALVTLASCGGHEHKAKDGWVKDSSQHWHACEGCDEMLDLAIHSYGDWVVDSQPDHDKSIDGQRHKVCKVCGFTMKEAIPAMPVFYVRGTITNWGAPTDDYKLKIDGTTETITGVVLPADAQWKIATEDWKNEANFNNLNEDAKQYFEAGDGGNIKVKVAGTYTITVTDALNAKTISVVKTA